MCAWKVGTRIAQASVPDLVVALTRARTLTRARAGCQADLTRSSTAAA